MSRSLERIAKVAGSTALSRVLGLLREMLAARVLGAGALNSAFLTAFTLPNLFRRFLGEGALTGALVPVLTTRLQKEGPDGVFEAVNQVFCWLILAGAVIVVAIWMLAGGALLLPGLEPRYQHGLLFSIALMPFLLFACGAAALSACLQVLGYFGIPALSQVWLNISMIVSLNVFGLQFAETDVGRVWWLCGGVLLGGVLQLATPAALLWRLGWRPKVAFVRGEDVREIFLLMGPSLFGAAVYQINLAASRFFAFQLDDSAASYINYASRLMELPMGMFAVAITTVVFPLITSHATRGDWPGFARSLRQGMRLNLAVTVPAAAGLILLASPIIRVIYQGGAFTEADTSGCVPVLVVFAAALPFYSLASLCTRAFHAIRDMRTPVHAAVVSLIVNVLLSLILPRFWGVTGLALASNLAMVVQALMLAVLASRRFDELHWWNLTGDIVKIFIACGAMTFAVLLCEDFLSVHSAASGFLRSITLAASIGLGIAAYGTSLWLLKIEGRDALWRMLTSRLRK
jgi:putative peptidoglycan lipid II flippase